MTSKVWLDPEGLKEWQPLFAAAMQARAQAYAPFSAFSVGAAVQTTDGCLIGGGNYESASYGLTLCAERAALSAAQAAGVVEEIVAVAICALDNRDQFLEGSDVVQPCGACRQWIFEASKRAGRDITVLCGNSDFTKVQLTSANELLPDGFA